MQALTSNHRIDPAPKYEPDINNPAPAKLLSLDRIRASEVGRKLRVYGTVMQYHPDLSLLVISSPPPSPSSARPTLLVHTAILATHLQGTLSRQTEHSSTSTDAAHMAIDAPDAESDYDISQNPPKPLWKHTDDQGRVWSREAPKEANRLVRLEPGMGVCVVGWLEKISSSLLPTYQARLHLNPSAFASPPPVILESILLSNITGLE